MSANEVVPETITDLKLIPVDDIAMFIRRSEYFSKEQLWEITFECMRVLEKRTIN